MQTPIDQSETDKRNILTYSALNCFRNCPRKYKHRYVDSLRPVERPDTLSFGSVIHEALELWYGSVDQGDRLQTVLEYVDLQYPDREFDETEKSFWQLARAMFTGYAAR